MSNHNRIVLKGIGRNEEGKAGGTITPGQLVALNSSGSYVVHATAGDYAERVFAIENALAGKGIADNYAANDLAQLWAGAPGDEVLAWLTTAQTVVVGDRLASAGNGYLRKKSSGDVPLAVALEAVTTTGSAARIRVRLL